MTMRSFLNGRLFWGIAIIGGGVALLLNQFGVVDLDPGDLVRRFWPTILVYFGALGLGDAVQRGMQTVGGERRGLLWGTALVNGLLLVAGLVEMGNANGWFSFRLNWAWSLLAPAVLILIGLRMLSGGLSRPGSRTLWSIMGGQKLAPVDWQMTDLAVVNFMGGAEIDLTRARLPESGEVLIDLYDFMGGTEIRLPAHLAFTCEGVAIMGGSGFGEDAGGGLVDYRVTQGGSGPLVRIRSFSIVGGSKIVQG